MDKGIDSDPGSPFKGRYKHIQDWAKEHDIDWRFYLLHDLQASGLEERRNGISKQQIKLLKGTLAKWTEVLSQASIHLKDHAVGTVARMPDWGSLLRHPAP